MKTDFTQTQQLISDYCKKNKITRRRAWKLVQLVTDPQFKGATNPLDRRDIWLALAASNQRDSVSDTIFKWLSLYVTIALVYPSDYRQGL